MARARNIKPGFFRNADLVELPFEARLLFIGLWTIADRAGILEDRPKQIKMELFPADNVDCDALLAGLESSGLIARYEHDGKRYIRVVNFCKHQNPHRDEKASTMPDEHGHIASLVEQPKKHSASTVQAQCDSDADTVAIGLIPDSLIPDSLIPEETPIAPKGVVSRAVQIQTWLDAVNAAGEEAIPASDPVFAYAEKARIPMDFIALAWGVFVRKAKASGKRQKSWPQTFRNYVEGNYLKLWALSQDGDYFLTTVGKQEQMVEAEHA